MNYNKILDECNDKKYVRHFILKELTYACCCISSILWGIKVAIHPTSSSMELVLPFICMVITLSLGAFNMINNSNNKYKCV